MPTWSQRRNFNANEIYILSVDFLQACSEKKKKPLQQEEKKKLIIENRFDYLTSQTPSSKTKAA